jgi:hypothetical protein
LRRILSTKAPFSTNLPPYLVLVLVLVAIGHTAVLSLRAHHLVWQPFIERNRSAFQAVFIVDAR